MICSHIFILAGKVATCYRSCGVHDGACVVDANTIPKDSLRTKQIGPKVVLYIFCIFSHRHYVQKLGFCLSKKLLSHNVRERLLRLCPRTFFVFLMLDFLLLNVAQRGRFLVFIINYYYFRGIIHIFCKK